MSPPSDGPTAEVEKLREQVMRLLRVEGDLFQRNQQLDAQRSIYQSLTELGKRLQGKLGAEEIAAAAVEFALYSLNLERAVFGVRDGEALRPIAWDGYYDDDALAAVSAQRLPLADPSLAALAPEARCRLRVASDGARDELGERFRLDEYAWLPIRDHEGAPAGYLVAGNTAGKAVHHGRVVAGDSLVLALENLVDLAGAALRNARLDAALARERAQLEARVEERTREREALLSEVIQAQERRLDELSTPVLPIAENILVMPLIGEMDEQRSIRFQQAALEGAAGRGAEYVIIDITGVKTLDAAFARVLLASASALGLLGARAVITGVSPQVAVMLVELDARLDRLVTCGTLQRGISYAMTRAGRRATRSA